MKIRLEGQYTDEDIRRAYALMGGTRVKVARIAGLVGIGVMVIGGAVLAVLLRGRALEEALVPMAPMLLLVVLATAMAWALPWFQAQQVKDAPTFQGTMRGVATEETFELKGPKAGGKRRWEEFVQYRMSDETVLLYAGPTAATTVPRRFFSSEADWDRFREQVRARVPAKRISERANQRKSRGRRRVGDERGRNRKQGS